MPFSLEKTIPGWNPQHALSLWKIIRFYAFGVAPTNPKIILMISSGMLRIPD